eukprot:GHVL01021721.1.p1 GENE.GHVL01021721.1~~GHVL01021721.1.p1  ORF type:complete len:2042 (+),score=373.80 GHVL01021721.1:82-6207(+)
MAADVILTYSQLQSAVESGGLCAANAPEALRTRLPVASAVCGQLEFLIKEVATSLNVASQRIQKAMASCGRNDLKKDGPLSNVMMESVFSFMNELAQSLSGTSLVMSEKAAPIISDALSKIRRVQKKSEGVGKLSKGDKARLNAQLSELIQLEESGKKRVHQASVELQGAKKDQKALQERFGEGLSEKLASRASARVREAEVELASSKAKIVGISERRELVAKQAKGDKAIAPDKVNNDELDLMRLEAMESSCKEIVKAFHSFAHFHASAWTEFHEGVSSFCAPVDMQMWLRKQMSLPPLSNDAIEQMRVKDARFASLCVSSPTLPASDGGAWGKNRDQTPPPRQERAEKVTPPQKIAAEKRSSTPFSAVVAASSGAASSAAPVTSGVSQGFIGFVGDSFAFQEPLRSAEFGGHKNPSLSETTVLKIDESFRDNTEGISFQKYDESNVDVKKGRIDDSPIINEESTQGGELPGGGLIEEVHFEKSLSRESKVEPSSRLNSVETPLEREDSILPLSEMSVGSARQSRGRFASLRLLTPPNQGGSSSPKRLSLVTILSPRSGGAQSTRRSSHRTKQINYPANNTMSSPIKAVATHEVNLRLQELYFCQLCFFRFRSHVFRTKWAGTDFFPSLDQQEGFDALPIPRLPYNLSNHLSSPMDFVEKVKAPAAEAAASSPFSRRTAEKCSPYDTPGACPWGGADMNAESWETVAYETLLLFCHAQKQEWVRSSLAMGPAPPVIPKGGRRARQSPSLSPEMRQYSAMKSLVHHLRISLGLPIKTHHLLVELVCDSKEITAHDSEFDSTSASTDFEGCIPSFGKYHPLDMRYRVLRLIECWENAKRESDGKALISNPVAARWVKRQLHLLHGACKSKVDRITTVLREMETVFHLTNDDTIKEWHIFARVKKMTHSGKKAMQLITDLLKLAERGDWGNHDLSESDVCGDSSMVLVLRDRASGENTTGPDDAPCKRWLTCLLHLMNTMERSAVAADAQLSLQRHRKAIVLPGAYPDQSKAEYWALDSPLNAVIFGYLWRACVGSIQNNKLQPDAGEVARVLLGSFCRWAGPITQLTHALLLCMAMWRQTFIKAESFDEEDVEENYKGRSRLNSESDEEEEESNDAPKVLPIDLISAIQKILDSMDLPSQLDDLTNAEVEDTLQPTESVSMKISNKELQLNNHDATWLGNELEESLPKGCKINRERPTDLLGISCDGTLRLMEEISFRRIATSTFRMQLVDVLVDYTSRLEPESLERALDIFIFTMRIMSLLTQSEENTFTNEMESLRVVFSSSSAQSLTSYSFPSMAEKVPKSADEWMKAECSHIVDSFRWFILQSHEKLINRHMSNIDNRLNIMRKQCHEQEGVDDELGMMMPDLPEYDTKQTEIVLTCLGTAISEIRVAICCDLEYFGPIWKKKLAENEHPILVLALVKKKLNAVLQKIMDMNLWPNTELPPGGTSVLQSLADLGHFTSQLRIPGLPEIDFLKELFAPTLTAAMAVRFESMDEVMDRCIEKEVADGYLPLQPPKLLHSAPVVDMFSFLFGIVDAVVGLRVPVQHLMTHFIRFLERLTQRYCNAVSKVAPVKEVLEAFPLARRAERNLLTWPARFQSRNNRRLPVPGERSPRAAALLVFDDDAEAEEAERQKRNIPGRRTWKTRLKGVFGRRATRVVDKEEDDDEDDEEEDESSETLSEKSLRLMKLVPDYVTAYSLLSLKVALFNLDFFLSQIEELRLKFQKLCEIEAGLVESDDSCADSIRVRKALGVKNVEKVRQSQQITLDDTELLNEGLNRIKKIVISTGIFLAEFIACRMVYVELSNDIFGRLYRGAEISSCPLSTIITALYDTAEPYITSSPEIFIPSLVSYFVKSMGEAWMLVVTERGHRAVPFDPKCDLDTLDRDLDALRNFCKRHWRVKSKETFANNFKGNQGREIDVVDPSALLTQIAGCLNFLGEPMNQTALAEDGARLAELSSERELQMQEQYSRSSSRCQSIADYSRSISQEPPVNRHGRRASISPPPTKTKRSDSMWNPVGARNRSESRTRWGHGVFKRLTQNKS